MDQYWLSSMGRPACQWDDRKTVVDIIRDKFMEVEGASKWASEINCLSVHCYILQQVLGSLLRHSALKVPVLGNCHDKLEFLLEPWLPDFTWKTARHPKHSRPLPF